MANIINAKRINQITTFLKSLNIKSKRFSEIVRTQNIAIIQEFNQAFTHSSEDKILNYEKLIINKNYICMCNLITKETLKSKTFVKFFSSPISPVPFYLVLLYSYI